MEKDVFEQAQRYTPSKWHDLKNPHDLTWDDQVPNMNH